MTARTTTHEGTASTVELTAADRCDRCSAAARVRATLPSGFELLFCKHHYNEHAARLAEQGAAVYEGAGEPVSA
ncbi:hypothetical protein P0W64_00205 [Tsukamurella sp. 8F]|uniref:DUF7455 domain-containing protein n=1 Tax=unclassified Tsukamurella TaxID=2633480 RepID=UPI0023B91576|nr:MULTISPECIES: hypothetical protein [unclassified Tsukamurella]MDF0532428.1 hypothetical protein [Tsukamurella sp. 8J]MDF0585194.1 hypothetical protein [Tsukamurella sp. 8F]